MPTYDAEFHVLPAGVPPIMKPGGAVTPRCGDGVSGPIDCFPGGVDGLGALDEVTKYSLIAGGVLLIGVGVAMLATWKSTPALGEAPRRRRSRRRLPKLLERCTLSVKRDQGYEQGRAIAICTASLQRAGLLKRGTQRLTKRGARRSAELRR